VRAQRGRTVPRRGLFALVTAPLLASACTTTPATAPPPTAPEGPPALGVRVVGQLGPVLVDGRGFTLYVSPRLARDPGACEADCLAAWPDVTENEHQTPVLLDGLSASLVGTTPVAHGVRALSYHGLVLHTYVGDAVPGSASGEGAGHTWYAVSAAGAPVLPAPLPPRPGSKPIPSTTTS
jgi:predicted lipoprotein with Yx(FWY)xxD motif